jgi:hypothetical protein
MGKTIMTEIKTTMMLGKGDLFLSVGFAVLWKMVFTTCLALGGKNKACRRIYTLSSRSQT